MYSRSYFPDGEGRLSLPENYDGCTFREDSTKFEEQTAEDLSSKPENSPESVRQNDRAAPVSLGDIPILSGLFGKGSLLGGLNLRIPTIGTEEILLIATAAFLFFSKSGDKEVALILLLLLLIN